MKKRKLGRTGLEVSEISFGAWQLGNKQDFDGMTDQTATRLVEAAIEKGINLFDTAPNYAAGRSESLLGKALQGNRDQVVLVSKFGHHPNGSQNYAVEVFWDSLEQSLNRLQTDYIDVLLLHNPPANTYAGEEPIWDALSSARKQGKIRHFGASLDFSEEAATCLNNTGSEVLEILFNILHQDIRQAFPLIREKGVGTLVKVPLDSGWLTGRFHAESRFTGIRNRWSASDIRRRADLLAELSWLQAEGGSLIQKALAYLLSYREVSCVIPGIRSHTQLLENISASETVLPESERIRLEEFWDEFTHNGNNLLPW